MTRKSIWAQAQEERIDRLERKARRRARGAKTMYLNVHTLKDRQALEARGWTCDGTDSVGIATNTRYHMAKSLDISAEVA